MIKINIDGSFEPGGYAGYGIVIINNTSLREISGIIKSTSSNVSEYLALIKTLEWLKKNKLELNEIEIKSDSRLLVNQMQGEWAIREGFYFKLAIRAKQMVKDFPEIKFIWIPREKNKRADQLSRMITGNYRYENNFNTTI